MEYDRKMERQKDHNDGEEKEIIQWRNTTKGKRMKQKRSKGCIIYSSNNFVDIYSFIQKLSRNIFVNKRAGGRAVVQLLDRSALHSESVGSNPGLGEVFFLYIRWEKTLLIIEEARKMTLYKTNMHDYNWREKGERVRQLKKAATRLRKGIFFSFFPL